MNKIPFDEYRNWSDEEVVNKLLHLLEKVSDMRRDHFATLADALGDCRASEAVEPISKGLGSSDEDVVGAAARALGKIEGASFVDRIKPLLSHEKKRVRVAAAEGLARLGLREGLDALGRFMKEEEEWRDEPLLVRDFLEIKCAKVLYELGDKDGVELLIRYLDHPSWWARFKVFDALEDIRAPECKQAVKEHVSKEREKEIVLKCVRILADLGDLSQLQHIMKVLVEGNPSQRRLAAETCYQLGFTLFSEPLSKRLGIEGNKEVREAIEWAIRRIDEKPVVVEGAPLYVEESSELITRLRQRILQNPNDRVAWDRKAEEEVYYFTAQLDKADRLEALRRLGFAYSFGTYGLFKSIDRSINKISKAEDCFKQVLAAKPDDPVALFGLARLRIFWRGGCNEERKSMLLRAKASCQKPLVNLYDWPGNDLEYWLKQCT